MRLRAVGRQVLVRLDYDLIDAKVGNSVIAMPAEVVEKLKGGCQVMTILSLGESAFDDEPPGVRESMSAGRQVLTGRYPGHAIALDPMAMDRSVNQYRMISCDEIHAVVAADGEEGVDVG